MKIGKLCNQASKPERYIREDFSMNVTVNREGNDATLKITVPAADVAKGYKSAVQRIASQVKIPGFRPGKAPRNVIEMHYGKEAVKEEAFNVVVNRAYQTALTQEKLMPVSDPSVNDEKAAFDSFEEGKDLNLEIKVTLKPEPELGEYKGLHVDKKDAAVSDEDVDKALDELRNRGAKMVDTADDTIIEKAISPSSTLPARWTGNRSAAAKAKAILWKSAPAPSSPASKIS